MTHHGYKIQQAQIRKEMYAGAQDPELKKAIKEHKRLVNLYLHCSDPDRKALLGARANAYRDNMQIRFK